MNKLNGLDRGRFPLGLKIAFFLRQHPKLDKAKKIFARTMRTARKLLVGLARKLGNGFVRFGPPSGIYSDFDLLVGGAKDGRIIIKDQGFPNLPSGSLVECSKLGQHKEQPYPIFWRKLRNVHLVSPSLVHLNDKKQISREAAYGRHANLDTAYNYIRLPRAVTLVGPWTSLVSMRMKSTARITYAHWLLDALPRLSLVSEFPENCKILVPFAPSSFKQQSLQLLGLEQRCRPTSERHLIIDEFYFSSPTSQIVCWNPYAINFLRDKFLPFSESKPDLPKRFYNVRKGFLRGAANEDEVIDLFKNLGWTIVDTAQFSFRDQISLFSNAEAICGIHGAGFANIVWCRPGCKVIELCSENYLSGCYELIALYNRLDYHFMIAPENYAVEAVIDLEKLRSILKSINLL